MSTADTPLAKYHLEVCSETYTHTHKQNKTLIHIHKVHTEPIGWQTINIRPPSDTVQDLQSHPCIIHTHTRTHTTSGFLCFSWFLILSCTDTTGKEKCAFLFNSCSQFIIEFCFLLTVLHSLTGQKALSKGRRCM